METFFEAGQKRNFIANVDPVTFSEQGVTSASKHVGNRNMVRVNFKFDPYDTNIKYPTPWARRRKITMGRNKETHKWEQLEDRSPMGSWCDPPRIHHGGAAYLCAPLRLDEHQTTMNAKEREHYCAGLVNMDKEAAIVAKCLPD
eukprot:1403667-Pyramimonas_sp.AAC.1